MAPARGGRKPVVVSDDEDDPQVDLEDILSDDEYSPKKSKAKTTSPLKALKDSPRKSSKNTTPKSSPQKKTKGKAAAPKPENGNGKGTLFSFFNAATQRQQAASSSSVVQTAPATLQKTASQDAVDVIDDGDFEASMLNGSHTALAARKRKQNDVTHLFDPAVGAASTASQKFRKISTVSKEAMARNADRRPWTEQFGPVDLSELAVHKKKVGDVRKLLEESISPRARPRLVVLKGPAGAGKTTTLQLLAKDLELAIKEWRNPNDVDIASRASATTSAQFEDFILRGGSFAGLELVTDPQNAEQNAPSDPITPTDTRNVVLIEEFPVSMSRSSPILQSFRSTLSAYLSMPHNPRRPAAPIFVILSETLLASSSFAEAITPHRLLGPTVLNHPLTATIEFNPIAPTLLTKALSLVATKESRITGRRRTPGPPVLSKLAEMGDVRSAISALEFLCLRGDEGDAWSGKVTFSKTKGKAAPKSNGTKSAEDGMTEQEREALKIVGGRENALGLWHAVGKVVYNKRKDSELAEPTSKHTKVPENDPEQILVELETDTSTFLAAVHENFPPSCTTSSNERTIASIDDCLAAISDADRLSLGRFPSGSGPGTAVEGMRQEEIAFHVGVRGVVFSLPYPVKREAVSGNRSRANTMAWPQSLRLWRGREEMDDLADLCVEDYRKLLADSPTDPHGSVRDGHKTEEVGWRRPSACSKQAMILEQAPYMHLVQQARRTASALKDHIATLSRFDTLHASSASLAGRAAQDNGEEEDELGKSPTRTRRTRTGKKDREQGSGLTLAVEEEVRGLVLSDDDIVDE